MVSPATHGPHALHVVTSHLFVFAKKLKQFLNSKSSTTYVPFVHLLNAKKALLAELAHPARTKIKDAADILQWPDKKNRDLKFTMHT
jgi:hypothetical protein